MNFVANTLSTLRGAALGPVTSLADFSGAGAAVANHLLTGVTPVAGTDAAKFLMQEVTDSAGNVTSFIKPGIGTFGNLANGGFFSNPQQAATGYLTGYLANTPFSNPTLARYVNGGAAQVQSILDPNLPVQAANATTNMAQAAQFMYGGELAGLWNSLKIPGADKAAILAEISKRCCGLDPSNTWLGAVQDSLGVSSGSGVTSYVTGALGKLLPSNWASLSGAGKALSLVTGIDMMAIPFFLLCKDIPGLGGVFQWLVNSGGTQMATELRQGDLGGIAKCAFQSRLNGVASNALSVPLMALASPLLATPLGLPAMIATRVLATSLTGGLTTAFLGGRDAQDQMMDGKSGAAVEAIQASNDLMTEMKKYERPDSAMTVQAQVPQMQQMPQMGAQAQNAQGNMMGNLMSMASQVAPLLKAA